MTDGRQPFHFDAGMGWYKDDRGQYWSVLSTITLMNDCVAPFFCEKPYFGVFDELRRSLQKGKDPLSAGKTVLSLLQEVEKKLKPEIVMGHAGQIYAFHPGEQIHCGMGYNGWIDPMVVGLFMRIVLYLAFVPAKFFASVCTLQMFVTDYAWGLMKRGVLDDGLTIQVFD
jgi:hypothetical protein